MSSSEEHIKPYFSKEGTLWIGLSRTGYRVVYIGEEWELVFDAWGQEPEGLGKFDTRAEAEQVGITTFNLKGG